MLAGGVFSLLRDARTVLPVTDELELVETVAGLRPATPDNAPVLGPSGIEGLLWATGHYRNGVLLTPITAEVVAETVTTGPARDRGTVRRRHVRPWHSGLVKVIL